MIKILTDSSAYLKRKEAEALDVTLSPMAYSAADGTMFVEGFVEENLAFDRLLQRNPGKMHTSQVAYAALLSAFSDLKSKGHEVLCMTMSSRLSGTYANARMAADKAGGVVVVDSQTTAGGFYLLIKKAHDLIASGMPLKEVEANINAARTRIKTFFSVDDMTALRNSGRLGNVKMSVSTILNIRPILKLEAGGITSHVVVRGKLEQQKGLVAAVPDGAKSVIVQHNHAPSRAEGIAAELKRRGFAPMIRGVGPVLAIHLGEGALGVSFEE